MDVQVRDESPDDVPAIETVVAAAFLQARHTSHTEHLMVNRLRDVGELAISLVAEVAGDVVGHVAVSAVRLSGSTRGWFGLGPLAVVPAYQRRGAGSSLVREALRRLRERGSAGCVVLGDTAYYGRFGFRLEPGLVLPNVPPECFQALSFRGTTPCATVSYHAAFDL